MDLPNRHWIPEGAVGLVATLERFNEALTEREAIPYTTRTFDAFLSLARRHDLYTHGGNDRMGGEFARFSTLLTTMLDNEEKRELLLSPSARSFVKTPPVFDETEMQRIRKMGEGVKRDMRNNPFKLFNDFKAVCSRFAPGDDPTRAFELLCSVLYLVGKNLKRTGVIHQFDPRKKERDFDTAERARRVFSDLVDLYFFGTGSFRIIMSKQLEDNPVFSPGVSFVEAQVTGRFTLLGNIENFAFSIDESPLSRRVAVVKRPCDLRVLDLKIADLGLPQLRRQLVPVTIHDVEMMAWVYAFTRTPEELEAERATLTKES
jgi:hypothetical protein